MTPEELGRIVRQAWVAYCKETGWRTAYESVCDWDEMKDEHAKEVDRRIGMAVARAAEAAARADGWREGAEKMREAAAALAENWKPRLNWDGWKADEVPEYIAIDIRNTLLIPEPPAEKG